MIGKLLVAVALASIASAACVQTRVSVSDASGLTAALANAQPGQTIALAAGVYSGHFVAKNSGTSDCRITLLGTFGVTLDGGSVSADGAVLTISGNYWNTALLVIQNGKKGLVVDGGSNNELSSMLISGLGEESVLLKNKASWNHLTSLSIGNSGKSNSALGYGVSIGADDNDACTDNSITSSTLGDRVTQQSVYVRKACTRTYVHDCSFTSGTTGATSFMTFYSDANQVYLCSFGNPTSVPLVDGIRLYGTGSIARSLSMDLRGSGYGINAVSGNTVCKTCSVSNAALGISSLALDQSC